MFGIKLAAIFSLALAADDKILLIGDSLAYMLAPYLKKEAAAEHIPFVSMARGGSTLAQWQDQGWAAKAIERVHPTIMLVSVGTNDRVQPDEFPTRAKSLSDFAEHEGVRIIWLSPPPMPFSVKFVWNALEQYEHIDAGNLAKEKDKIHVTYWANKQWAHNIFSYLNGENLWIINE